MTFTYLLIQGQSFIKPSFNSILSKTIICNNQPPAGSVPQITHAKAMFEEAIKLQNTGNFKDAISIYNSLISTMEDYCVPKKAMSEIYVNLGKISSQQTDFKTAKKHFEMALKHRPNLGTAHVNLALLALSQGKVTSVSTDSKNVKDKTSVKRESLLVAIKHCRKALKQPIDHDDEDVDNEENHKDNIKVKGLAERIIFEAEKALHQ